MKKITKIIFSLLLASLVLGSLASCKNEGSKEEDNKKKFTKTFYEYFDTITTVVGYEESEEEFLRTASLIESRYEEYHKLYDVYHSSSDKGYETSYAGITNIKDINALVDGEHVELTVSKTLIDFLLYCKEIHTLTGGETNVAMGSVLSLWHNERENSSKNPANSALPSNDALTEAAKHTDINDLIINTEKSTVFLADPKMTLDVGAIAKGYATEMIAKELEGMGITSYAISAGGNVRTIGAKPAGEKWSIGIENPFDMLTDYLETLKIENQSVVTSGSYQRYYTVDGKIYHHIIDKDTLYPSEYFSSVSVVTESSALADALSTALFTMPLDAGLQLVESLDGVEAIWLTKSGEKTVSSGFSKLT